MRQRRPLFPPQAKRDRLRNKGRDATSRLTINGPISVHVRRWQQPSGGSQRPGAEVLGLPVSQPSVGFRQIACGLALNANSSFVGEARLMGQLGLGPVSWEKLRQVVEAEGQTVQEAQQQQRFGLAWQARGCADATCEGSLVCVGVDGVMTRQVTDEEKRKRRQKVAGKRGARAKAGQPLKPLPKRRAGADGPWKEVKIVGAYQQDHQHRHWRSTTLNHLMAAVLMIQVARRVGLALTQAKVAVVDGADWIEARLRECLPDLTAIILDFFHLSEHVHAATGEAFGEGTAPAGQWAERLLTAIRREGFAVFDALLGQCLAEHGQMPDAHAALTKLRQYVGQRQEMVNYPDFEARGWPIGSGPTESMASVLTSRVKGRGRRWDAPHIDAVMALQALEVGDEWDAYWQTQRQPSADKCAA